MTDAQIYKQGDYFETRFPYDNSKNIVWKAVGDFLDKRYDIHGTVVDIGAGYGYFLNGIEAERKIAVDYSLYPLARTEDDVTPVIGTATDVPLKQNIADVVMASNVLEHLSTDEIQLALAEFRRILKPNGTLLVVTPNFALAPRQYFDDFTHQSILTHRSLSDLLKLSGFVEHNRTTRFLPFSSQSRVPIYRWLVSLYLRIPISPFAGQSLFVAKPA